MFGYEFAVGISINCSASILIQIVQIEFNDDGYDDDNNSVLFRIPTDTNLPL